MAEMENEVARLTAEELGALLAARDAEIEVATRAHLAEFKTWIAENEPEPPEKRARLLQQDYNPLLYGYWAYKYWHPEHTFDAAAMIQHYLDWPPDKSPHHEERKIWNHPFWWKCGKCDYCIREDTAHKVVLASTRNTIAEDWYAGFEKKPLDKI